jgi:hypothetical protein
MKMEVTLSAMIPPVSHQRLRIPRLCQVWWGLALLTSSQSSLHAEGFSSTSTLRFPMRSWARTHSLNRSSFSVASLHPSKENVLEPAVPRTMRQAMLLFWADGRYHGPRWVALSLATLLAARLLLPQPLHLLHDGPIFMAAVAVWSLQEHVLHGKFLHSERDWYGQCVHMIHHAKPYYHVSLDPAPLLMGWMWTALVLLLLVLPTQEAAVTATLGYSCAGLFYEWTHFIVHTKVPFRPNSVWRRLKDHHMQHHLLDNRYWLSFSIPAVDRLFGTGPSVQEVMRRRERGDDK